MTITKRFAFLSIALSVAVLSAGQADAQFSFGGGGIRVGGSGIRVGGNIGSSKARSTRSIEENTLFYRTKARNMLRRNQPVTNPPLTQPVLKPKPKYCPTPVEPAPVIRPVPVQPTPAPIVHPVPAPPAPAPDQSEDKSLQLTFLAQDAFAKQNYTLAIDLMDRVVEQSPKSVSAYQFRALSHFAQGNYDEAAADIYETLLRGNLWTWDTIHPLYKDNQTYTKQYRTLYHAAKDDTESMSKHFVLAYHHLVLGHLDHGAKELEIVLKIQPEEPVTTQLLTVVRQRQNDNAVAMR